MVVVIVAAVAVVGAVVVAVAAVVVALVVAVKLVGNQGKVMGVDLSYVEEIPGAHIVRDNIENESLVDDVLSYFGRKVGAVVCDLSPQVTGNWSVDHARQISLNYDCTKLMDKVLAHKGNAVFKVFDGEYSLEFRDYVKKKFSRINLTKPDASRKQTKRKAKIGRASCRERV